MRIAAIRPAVVGGIALAALFSMLSAQVTFVKTYGRESPYQDWGNAVRPTPDGGYVIVGSTNSYGAGNYDVWLIRTDAYGETLWTKTYGDSLYQGGSDVQVTSDGGLIIVGTTTTLDRGDDIWVLRTNAQGETLWTRTFGSDASDVGYSVIQTTDQGYMIAGQVGTSNVSSAIQLRLDAEGNEVWSHIYGGSLADEARCVRQTLDGGYVLVGYITDAEYPNRSDVSIMKTDSSGAEEWFMTYGNKGDFEMGYSVALTPDSGCIIAAAAERLGAGGYTHWALRIDKTGETLWTWYSMTLGVLRSVSTTGDQGYVFTGCVGGGSATSVYLVRLGPQGSPVWSRVYFDGGSEDWGQCIRVTPDGGYCLTGFTNTVGYYDVFLIKTDSSGTVGVGEHSAPVSGLSGSVSIPSVVRVGSPVSISYATRFPSWFEVQLFDALGRRATQTSVCDRVPSDSQVVLDTRGLSPGAYFCQLLTRTQVLTRRVVLVR